MWSARRSGAGRRQRRVMAAVAAAVMVLVTACTGGGGGPRVTGPGASPTRPNIVFVLTDDLSWNLVQYMPHLLALQKEGMTFDNFTVADSLCCPSRASILTGEFPHDTRVFTNVPQSGGFKKFYFAGDEHHTFATSVHHAGYRTALYGKYLNGYLPGAAPGHKLFLLNSAYVPPGWSSWGGVGTGGYREYGFTIADDRVIKTYGSKPRDYLTTVLQQRGRQFIESAAAQKQPFVLDVATFAPHGPSIPAPQDVGTFPGLTAPRTPAFDVLPRNAPPWLRDRPKVTPAAFADLDRRFQLRVESVQAVDRMIGALEDTLTRTGQAGSTVFVFSSDNGFHIGDYTLGPGKQTAFDTDVRVPLIVAGPGIKPGTTNHAIVESIDLAPTFDELAGAPVPSTVDGRSLVPLLHGQPVSSWRTVAGVEHQRRPMAADDPDLQSELDGAPPSYDAIRTARYTYVRYLDGQREYYDRVRDPYELDNVYGRLSPARRAELDRIVAGLTGCHGSASCWAAGRPTARGAEGA
jgi:N-acetylglucosamine-6-sulfatase